MEKSEMSEIKKSVISKMKKLPKKGKKTLMRVVRDQEYIEKVFKLEQEELQKLVDLQPFIYLGLAEDHETDINFSVSFGDRTTLVSIRKDRWSDGEGYYLEYGDLIWLWFIPTPDMAYAVAARVEKAKLKTVINQAITYFDNWEEKTIQKLFTSKMMKGDCLACGLEDLYLVKSGDRHQCFGCVLEEEAENAIKDLKYTSKTDYERDKNDAAIMIFNRYINAKTNSVDKWMFQYSYVRALRRRGEEHIRRMYEGVIMIIPDMILDEDFILEGELVQ